jgi:hypothetical protein
MIKNLGVSFTAVLLALVVAELFLRNFGWQPGQFQYNRWVKRVEQLQPLYGFLADENGVFKVDTAFVFKLVKDFGENLDDRDNSGWYCTQHQLTPEICSPKLDVYADDEKLGVAFRERYIKLKRDGCTTCSDSIFELYASNPFNADGFYSIPFNSKCEDEKRVLLLGDSFTWGHSTTNKTRSFSNELLARGRAIYNTGISGSDVAQYRRVLEVYSSVVEPDLVIMNFFMGNDIANFERVPEPYVPVHYATNAGNLLSFQADTSFANMNDAYANIINNMVIPQIDDLNGFAAKTVVGTIVWTGLVRFGYANARFGQVRETPEIPETRNELLQISEFCKERDIPFVLSVIPNLYVGKLAGFESRPEVFDGLPHIQPAVTIDDYNADDGHFNDEGHLFYANFLDSLITKQFGDE